MAVLAAAACQPHQTVPSGKAPLRYRDPIFTTVNKQADVVYGSATTQAGTTMALKMDVYAPKGDPVTANRPAIVWIHGGAFKNGDKTSAEIVDEATTFAKKGYVNVSINYRLSKGCFPAGPECVQGIIDAKHDAQAAVRYLRLHKSSMKIDPDRIAIAGSSAGAYTALNVAYGSEDVGTSGNPGFSSKVRAAVSLSGAAATTTPSAGEPPALFFHGDADPVVPYSAAVRTVDAAHAAGLEAYLTTFPDGTHVPYGKNRTVILTQTTNFLYWELGLDELNA
ncbi:alpha/beta hydrolase [Aquihabitans sp. G128]|uniref:alpha/beta hydrolase n=1 Tax=Aquihabitans sp. G128 TaxID=2849779 RepID=UPI0020B4577D|nr:carboxylesterase family protein [Aquihabitans sp. G128]